MLESAGVGTWRRKYGWADTEQKKREELPSSHAVVSPSVAAAAAVAAACMHGLTVAALRLSVQASPVALWARG